MQTYRIADLLVNMDVHGRTAVQAEIYKTDNTDKPEITVTLNLNKTVNEGDFSPSDVEYMDSCSVFYRQLLCFNGLLLHSSAVVMDGRAYLFSASSGTGKSTHTRLWQQVFGADRAQIINDDKPALRQIDGVWYAYGTPWSGKSTTSLNLRVPIAGICFLKQGKTNEIRKISAADAAFRVLEQTIRPKNSILTAMLLESVDKLVSQVETYEMQCNMEPEAAMLSYQTMSAGT
ncbi:MAG: hypothetical protein IJB17_03910 [Oscillospiraceae bacterium]|nr:hypothetical protein [Oscillospiraceae bacterium]